MIRVMYVDDEADSVKMESKFDLMKKKGIEVIPVTRVPDVFPQLERMSDSIDLIILDIIMPPEEYYSLDDTNGGTSTGINLLKEIRDRYKSIPIIIVSVRRLEAADEEIETTYDVADYLEKPVSAFDVVNAIKRVLRNKQ